MSKKIGKCPNCKYVHGEQVDLNFPNDPLCCECGAALEKAGVVSDVEFEEAMGHVV